MTEPSDHSLIQDAIKGDTSAFTVLVSRYQNSLIRFLRFRLNCEADAQDVFQETFLNAHQYLRSYDPKYAFSTWLFNIALRQMSQLLAKKKKQSSLESQSEIIIEDQQAEGELMEHSQVLSEVGSNDSNIWLLIKPYLSKEHLNLLWFFYVEEYTGKQIAAIMNRSVAWVKINLIRAKAHLKSILSEKTEASFYDLLNWVKE